LLSSPAERHQPQPPKSQNEQGSTWAATGLIVILLHELFSGDVDILGLLMSPSPLSKLQQMPNGFPLEDTPGHDVLIPSRNRHFPDFIDIRIVPQ
jgi:hypothetical protein